MHVLDIEPKHVSGGGVDVVFRDNTVSTYGLSSRYRGWFDAVNGQVQGRPAGARATVQAALQWALQ